MHCGTHNEWVWQSVFGLVDGLDAAGTAAIVVVTVLVLLLILIVIGMWLYKKRKAQKSKMFCLSVSHANVVWLR